MTGKRDEMTRRKKKNERSFVFWQKRTRLMNMKLQIELAGKSDKKLFCRLVRSNKWNNSSVEVNMQQLSLLQLGFCLSDQSRKVGNDALGFINDRCAAFTLLRPETKIRRLVKHPTSRRFLIYLYIFLRGGGGLGFLHHFFFTSVAIFCKQGKCWKIWKKT